MFRSLRSRLILSHLLPLLVVVPLMGIALIYLLEETVLLPNLTSGLKQQAALIVERVADQPDVWIKAAAAQAFVKQIGANVSARLMLLDQRGRLLASTDPTDADRLNQRFDHPDLPRALAGEAVVRQNYSRRLDADIADVWLPVMTGSEQLQGVVRLSYELTTVYQQFATLRWLVLGVLIVGLMLGAAVGWVLALNLQRPIAQVTQAVEQLSRDRPVPALPELQPAEFAQLVRAFNSLNERLHSLEAARHQLLANMVHELGRPLGALQSGVEALRGGADEDPVLRHELLAGTDAEIQRLRRLLADLSRHYDQALGPLELNRRPIELSEWLSAVLIPWREAAQRKGLQWTTANVSQPLVVEADPDRLAQAVGNIIDNAIKYTPPGGRVSVELAENVTAVTIRISDTGSGISAEDLPHVFEPFYRGHATRRFPQGMGLGLTIARDLLVAHGGRLEVISTVGQGSHFTLWLPRPDSPTSPSL